MRFREMLGFVSWWISSRVWLFTMGLLLDLSPSRHFRTLSPPKRRELLR